MTEPREVTVSDTDAMQFLMEWADANETKRRDMGIGAAKQALAAFLARRVPDAKPNSGISLHVGFNACRDKVLKGV